MKKVNKIKMYLKEDINKMFVLSIIVVPICIITNFRWQTYLGAILAFIQGVFVNILGISEEKILNNNNFTKLYLKIENSKIGKIFLDKSFFFLSINAIVLFILLYKDGEESLHLFFTMFFSFFVSFLIIVKNIDVIEDNIVPNSQNNIFDPTPLDFKILEDLEEYMKKKQYYFLSSRLPYPKEILEKTLNSFINDLENSSKNALRSSKEKPLEALMEARAYLKSHNSNFIYSEDEGFLTML